MEADTKSLWDVVRSQEGRLSENERRLKDELQALRKEMEALQTLVRGKPPGASNNVDQRAGCLQETKRHAREYGERSSLHGLQFITDSNSPLIGRILWAILLVVSFALCIHFIRRVWVKWDESPIITAFSSSPMGTEQIAFPAVTVCRNWKMDEDFSVERFSRQHGRRDASEMLKILCALKGSFYPSNVNIPDIPECDEIGDIHDPLDFSRVNFLNNVAPLEPGIPQSINDDIFNQRKSSIWTKTLLTDYGICRSFNIIHGSDMFKNDSGMVVLSLDNLLPRVKNWSSEGGYTTSDSYTQDSTYPRSSPTKMLVGGLSMKIMRNEEVRPILKPAQGGYKVQVHSPDDLPNMLKDAIDVAENKTLRIVVSPIVVKADKSLRGYSYERRECVFPEEKQLAFFKPYRWINCEMERFEVISAKLCGCVGLHVPRPKTIPYCGARKWSCRLELFEGVDNGTYSLDDNCPWPCSEIEYHTEISIDHLHSDETDKYGRSANIEVYFKDLVMPVKEKVELYDQAEFLGYCGGLLSLFLGGSILTLVEMVYFFVVRLVSKDSLRGRKGFDSPFRLQELPVGH